MHRVVSVSLGSSARDKTHECVLLGREFRIERLGTDGDAARFKALVEELDGEVDAIGVGGADLWVVVGSRRYPFREVAALVSGVRRTPVVDGSGLKHTLEREAVSWLDASGTLDLGATRALLVSAVDRFGMAQELESRCREVVYGDAMFGLGLPWPIRSYRALSSVARALLPVVTRLPFRWFYPTGIKQELRTPRFAWAFDRADLVAGDWHYVRRFAPDRMPGKTILTQSLRKADLEWLRSTGAWRVIATTPAMGGETFATNVMEAVVATLLGKRPEETAPGEILAILRELDWKPQVFDLSRPGT